MPTVFLLMWDFRGTIAGALIIGLYFRKSNENRVLELSRISARMVHLDFRGKVPEKQRNEIDVLGKNINTLSASWKNPFQS